MNPLKRVYSLGRLFPAFLCFEHRLSMSVVRILTRDISKALDTIKVDSQKVSVSAPIPLKLCS
jgi:hypothetical protein